MQENQHLTAIQQEEVERAQEAIKQHHEEVIATSPVTLPEDELEWRTKEGYVTEHLNLALAEVAKDPDLTKLYIRPYESELAKSPGLWVLNPPRAGAFITSTSEPVNIWVNMNGSSVVACSAEGEDVTLRFGQFNNPGANRRLLTDTGIFDFDGDSTVLKKGKTKIASPKADKAKRKKRKAAKKARKGNR